MVGHREVSESAARVLRALLADSGAEAYATQVAAAARLRTGTIYPVLARLERLGWVESRWEQPGATSGSGPARRCYRITGDGAQQVQVALAAVDRRAQWRLRPVAGQS